MRKNLVDLVLGAGVRAAVVTAMAVLSSLAAAQNIEDLSESAAAAAKLGTDPVGRPGASSAIPVAAPSVQLPSLKGVTTLTGGAAPRTGTVRGGAGQEPNEFQKFLQSAGVNLPLFGQQFFQNAPSTFAPVADAPVAPDYVVGPGDEVVIRAWGQIEANLRLTVDRNGMLVIPKVGAVFVGGMRYQDMQGAIHAEMSKVYRNFEMVATMGQLRGIQVFVVGQAKQPGSYTVGSMSTLVTALFESGGPSSKGSMRRIQVKRGNKVLTEFDLYDMLLKGDTSKDIRLRQGDVIVIPPVGAMVAVTGSIGTPAVYELKETSASLREVVGWAGGLTATTEGNKVALERIENRKSRLVAEIQLNDLGLNQALRDGDLVRFLQVKPKFENAVSVRGFVAEASRYPWQMGMRIKNILPDAAAVTGADYWRRRNDVSTTGSVSLIPPDEVSWDYAVIERLKPDNTVELVPFNLGAAILQGDPQHNLLLEAGDVVTVFSKSDIRVPQSSQRRYVRLEGEFVAAGIYSAKPGETLRQLVARIGGLTSNAFVYGAEFTRESTRILQQKQLDESLDRMEREIQRVGAESAGKALSDDDAKTRANKTLAQQTLLTRLRTIKATGRIVLEAGSDSASSKDLPDLPLEDGDRFLVPSRPSVVSVFGSVFNPNTFIYKDSRRVDEYLAMAGGPTKTADTGSVYLLRANGTVVSKRQSGWFGGAISDQVFPGDAVIVPEDFERVALSKELKDWSQVFYQFALGVAGLKVLKD